MHMLSQLNRRASALFVFTTGLVRNLSLSRHLGDTRELGSGLVAEAENHWCELCTRPLELS